MSRVSALAEFLGCEGYEDSIEEVVYNDFELHAEGGEYYVFTDEEADEECARCIGESLWAFNADFLSGMTGLDSKIFEALSGLCEDANCAVRALIDATCGFDDFVEAAISADGRGHFIASYDGEEHSVGDYYIYWIN